MGNINIKGTGVSVNDDSGHIAQLTVTTAGAGVGDHIWKKMR